METVNLAAKLSHVAEHWSPKIVGEVNDCYVKVVKLEGSSSGIIMTTKTSYSW